MATPLNELHTDLTIGQYFDNVVAEHGDNDFIAYPDCGLRWTYSEFDERVNNLAKGLLAYVIKQSDMRALCIIDSFRDVNYVDIVRELFPEAATPERGHLDSKEFPELKALTYMGPEKHRGFYTTPELILLGEHYPDEPYLEARSGLHCDDTINMQHTSGTTGSPRATYRSSPGHALLATSVPSMSSSSMRTLRRRATRSRSTSCARWLPRVWGCRT